MSFNTVAYLVYLESISVLHYNNSEIFRHLVQVLMSEKERSASALLIGRVHASNEEKTMDVWKSIPVTRTKC